MVPILQYPHDKVMLMQKSSTFIKASQELLDNMLEYKDKCYGLSAVQFGHPVRLIMLRYGTDYIFLTNPEIIKVSKQTWSYPEGCLSVDNGSVRVTIRRPKRVKVRYTDLEGHQHTLKAEGLTARCIQHEVDHLEGILIIDYVR